MTLIAVLSDIPFIWFYSSHNLSKQTAKINLLACTVNEHTPKHGTGEYNAIKLGGKLFIELLIVYNIFIGGYQRTTNHSQHSANILRETKVSRVHLTPELRLHLITPDCRLFYEPLTEQTSQIFTTDPFWAFYWPGGQALSRYILDNPAAVQDCSVLDVGSGCGATSLACMKSGATYVVANDIDAVAGVAATLNAELNNMPTKQLRISTDNLIGSLNVSEDVILLGDLFYDEEFVTKLLPWLYALQDAGKLILIGDPGRHGLTERKLNFLQKLASYELTDNCCIENHGFRHVHVWRFQ